MTLIELIENISTGDVSVISAELLAQVKTEGDLLLETDTRISDYIRIIAFNGKYIFQEQSRKNEILIRIYNKYEDALILVNRRLKTYDDMWDGCGCKINYYA